MRSKLHLILCLFYSKQVFHGSPNPGKMYNINSNFNKCVDLAAELITLGNIIAVPTDTIYGLAGDAQNIKAVQDLYNIKGRSLTKPVSICVRDVEEIEKWGKVQHISKKLLSELMPGPVTIIVERTPLLNPYLNPNVTKVGIRIPKSNFIQAVTKKLNTPLALTSANKSNDQSSVCIEEFSSLWSSVDAVFDGGNLGLERQGSTIVDLSIPNSFSVVREGGYLLKTMVTLKKYNLKWIS